MQFSLLVIDLFKLSISIKIQSVANMELIISYPFTIAGFACHTLDYVTLLWACNNELQALDLQCFWCYYVYLKRSIN